MTCEIQSAGAIELYFYDELHDTETQAFNLLTNKRNPVWSCTAGRVIGIGDGGGSRHDEIAKWCSHREFGEERRRPR